MATQTKSTTSLTDFADKATASSKKATAAYLDSYEKSVVTLADSYEKAAAATNVDWWLETVVSAQAGFARELTKAYTGAARELVS